MQTLRQVSKPARDAAVSKQPHPALYLLSPACCFHKVLEEPAGQAPALDPQPMATFPWGKEHPTGMRDPLVADGRCHHGSPLAAGSTAPSLCPEVLLLVSITSVGGLKNQLLSPHLLKCNSFKDRQFPWQKGKGEMAFVLQFYGPSFLLPLSYLLRPGKHTFK